jgi:Carboxypeptidase regulatory-like domain/TonB-dependent Receptor Plug Domain/TonB dependent receptor
MHWRKRFTVASARRTRLWMSVVQKSLNFTDVVGFLLILIFATALNAQVNTGSLSGLALDPSGASVANTTVTVKALDTGYTRSIVSASDGAYSLPNLPIGTYSLTASANGFSRIQQQITIDVGERVRLDLHFTIGTTDQTVEVQASTVNLSRDDASIGTVVTNETIKETPLYLRNWDDLLRTVPGVQISRYTNQSGATSAGRTGDFNVNGVHSLQNNFILDGIDNNTFSENVQELSTEASHPSVDVISEFNVITNPYSAEYGRGPGAVVSVNTRGGTNTIHGSAYEYVRNQYFDAFDYFTKQTTDVKAQDNQNQFGASLGGPILRNRIFGFFNYEGTRIKQGVSRVSTVPLDNERVGDFSPQAAAAAGVAPYPTVYNLSTCSAPYTAANCKPLLNNNFQSDPTAHVDAAVAKLIALFPEPNDKQGGATYPEYNNFARTGALTDFNDSYNGRLDWTPSPNDTVFSRYNYFNRSRSIPGYFGGLTDGTGTSAWGNQTLKGHSLVIGWTHILNSRMVNDFRFGWVRDFSYGQQQPFNLSQTSSDFVPGIPPSPAIGGGVPLTAFTNHTYLGSPDFLPKSQTPMLYQYADTLSWIKGDHNLKFGINLLLPMRNIFQDEPGMRGDLYFAGVFSGLGNPSGITDYADGLFGAPYYVQLTNVYFVDQRLWMAGGFVEDDWKVTPKLTLNLGLRYDFATPPMEGKNRMANFNPAGAGSLDFATSGSVGERALVDPGTTNFGPRIGIAYALDQKTVVRAGYGVYYTLLERIGSENQMALNPPFLVNKAPSSTTVPILTPEVGFPSDFLDPPTINSDTIAQGVLQPFHIRAVDPSAKVPMVQQWSFGVQREIGTKWLADINYVGTKSTHLDVLLNYNQPIISGGVVQPVVPYPDFGQVEYTSPVAYGNYNGLQMGLSRTMSKGLSLHAAYTYSRALDNAPEELENNPGGPPDGRNQPSWYGPSEFNTPHRVAVNYIYELPFGRGKTMLNSGVLSWILGNWRTSGVYTYFTGAPFTAVWGNESSLLDPYGFATAVPNVVGKVQYIHKSTCWFYASSTGGCSPYGSGHTDAFADPGVGVVGNGTRNSLVSPSTSVFDAALMKDFPIFERVKAQFRWEVFNAGNRPLFAAPGGDLSGGSAAQITSLSGDPRVMQFALRIDW